MAPPEPEIERPSSSSTAAARANAANINDRNALFGKYEVGRLLGCGAFAKVYHARDLRTGLSVALKVINKKKLSASSSGSLAANVKREISIMSRLRHPNIVRLHEVLATKSKIYFVLEFVKGGELFAKVSKGRLSEDHSRKYFQQLISAVGYCHSRGVFHRDLKPENLLLDDADNLKVSDFGLSAVRDQIRADGLLHTLCGTPAYVAPEILTKRGYDGAKVDVWSCGVILYVLNAGYLPFNDPNLMALYKKIYRGEFRCPKWMSPDLKRFLHRLLDTNPDTRISVHEIISDPWFKKGPAAIDLYGEDCRSAQKAAEAKATSLNAFDLISFSAGLDLSGLLDESYSSMEDEERLVTRETAEKVIEKVEELAGTENMRMKRYKEWDMALEAQNGNLVIDVGLYHLTDGLMLVEVKRVAGEATAYRDVLNNKLKPLLGLSLGGSSSNNSRNNVMDEHLRSRDSIDDPIE